MRLSLAWQRPTLRGLRVPEKTRYTSVWVAKSAVERTVSWIRDWFRSEVELFIRFAWLPILKQIELELFIVATAASELTPSA